MSRSRTSGTPSRVEARRKKTVRTRIVLSLTAAAAAVAVGVAVADSDDDVRAGGRGPAAAESGAPGATATPATSASPEPSADGASPAGATPSATPSAAASDSAAPTQAAQESRPATSAPAPAAKPARTPATTTGGGSGGSNGSAGGSAAESAVLALVNKERAAAGCGALSSNSELSSAARAYSDTMARSGVMSHTGPDGSTMTSRVEAAGYGWSRLGENIARGQADAAAVMNAWMNSPGHRANILNCEFREIGIGVHQGDGGPWWTQDFGTPK
ncbi:CAP domain-containing protein [Streptomyces sp. NPDC091268]|uniref:CAP domain-containing protein n=1 Tax=Streptomyces sp. NPDC091268 TaxID=3365979 RepID=UPI0037F6E1B3